MGIEVSKVIYSFEKMSSAIPERAYAIEKVNTWYQLLGNRFLPLTWHTATKKETKVTCAIISKQEEYDLGIQELAAYIEIVNHLHGTDFSLG